nr:hypothetical protein [Paenarthrobacter ilicis]
MKELQDERDLAERYGQELGWASNSYERAKVHEKCKSHLGEGSPSKIISKVDRELNIRRRDAAKLERRFRDIARRGSLDVQALVIDGSNLSYEGSKFLGLFAVRALCTRLASEFEVTVVFDASTRTKLGIPTDEKLRSQLPGVNVHVVVSGTSADETILDVAQDPTTFVVSNDRFADFPDKAVVREDRIIRHEIINGRVLVRDLKIDIAYRQHQPVPKYSQALSR